MLLPSGRSWTSGEAPPPPPLPLRRLQLLARQASSRPLKQIHAQDPSPLQPFEPLDTPLEDVARQPAMPRLISADVVLMEE